MGACCGEACSVMNQKQIFYSSQMSIASENLRKMAQMQAAAGMHDLARSSMQDATAREHSEDYYNNDPKKDIRDAFDYGEQRAKWGI